MTPASDCLFCSIVTRAIPADVVLERDDVLVFRDIAPAAPTHLLAVPRRHLKDVTELSAGDGDLLFALIDAARTAATQEGIDEGGYRLVFNIGDDAGNTVPHLHLHVLGGRQMEWPPG